MTDEPVEAPNPALCYETTARICEIIGVDPESIDIAELPERVAAALKQRDESLVSAVQRLLAMNVRLLSELSWCAGNLSADDQQLPEAIEQAIKEAIALVAEIGSERV